MLGLNFEKGGNEERKTALAVAAVKQHAVNYPCMMGDEDVWSQVPAFGSFPTTLFIDKSGKVRLKAVGLHDYGYLEAIVTELLAEDVPADLEAK